MNVGHAPGTAGGAAQRPAQLKRTNQNVARVHRVNLLANRLRRTTRGQNLVDKRILRVRLCTLLPMRK
jgi:hypothetical protein